MKRFPASLRAVVVALGAAAASECLAAPLVIGGFDGTRGSSASISVGSVFSSLRASISSHFPDTTFVGSPTLTPEFLSGIDILFISSATGNSSAITPLSTSEQAAILAFIKNGRTAVLCVDNGSFAGSASDPANESLVDAFGMDVTGTGAPWPQSATVLNPAASPVTSGPFGTVTTWLVGWSGWFDTVPANALVLANVNQSGLPGLVVFPRHALAACSGVVVAYSDTTAFWNGWFAPGSANDILMLNTIAYVSQPTCEVGLCGDIDANGAVDAADLGSLLGAWGTSQPSADLDGSGAVNAADLAILLGNWGPCDQG